MKKSFRMSAMLIVSIALVSWGYKGHQAVGLIAENHLTAKSKEAIKHILGNEDLADVANYADDIKADQAMRYTAPWHFLDLPSGCTFDQFAKAVHEAPPGNIYNAILNCERDLENPQKSRTQKAFALKLLVHFVGDCHQPMHVAHSEDKGGNNTAIKFFGQSENLHGLWDYAMIDREGLNYKQMAQKYDTATPIQINKWQADPVIKWMYESYLITNEVYKEAAADLDFKDDYYQSHMDVLRARILKAGIRLAGVLNHILDPGAES